MVTFIHILTIIVAICLICITSLQNSKKEGEDNVLGSMGAHQIMGVKKTSDLLEQLTWGLLMSLFFLSMISFTLIKRGSQTPPSPNLERIEQHNLFMEHNQDDAIDTTPPIPADSQDQDVKEGE